MPVRASQILRVRKVWLLPVTIAAVFVALMSVIYFGSVVNPPGHLHGLPVMVVNQDAGATAHGQRVDVGASLVSALEQSGDVTSRLEAAQHDAHAGTGRRWTVAAPMRRWSSPPRSAARSCWPPEPATRGAGVPAKASVELLENSRLGSLGVNLAAGVMTPAITKISPQIGTKLKPLATPAAAADPVTAAQLADPVALTTATYRPLPDHSALGLSAFYIALLAIMSGFVGATLINASIDSALGYGATELGPRWRHAVRWRSTAARRCWSSGAPPWSPRRC